jgi:hypothetical protein
VSDREALPDEEPGLPNFEDLIQRAQVHQARSSGVGGASADNTGLAPSGTGEGEAASAGVANDARASAARSPMSDAGEAARGDGGDAVAMGAEAARSSSGAVAGPAKPLSPTRALAVYLTQLRQLLTEATESRRAWVRQIGIMMQDARTRPLAMVSPAAGKIGSEQLSRFGELRERLSKLEPPPGCGDLQALFNGWLDRHTEVCQILVDFGRTGDLAKLRTSQSLLAEGRSDLQRFQAEYTRRVTALKKQVDAAKKRRKAKWPFGRPKAT